MKQTEYVISIRERITVSFNGKTFCCSTLLCSEVNSRSTFLYSLPKSVVDASTVNAFKARLGNCWLHQTVKYDLTADLTETGNRSEEVIK